MAGTNPSTYNQVPSTENDEETGLLPQPQAEEELGEAAPGIEEQEEEEDPEYDDSDGDGEELYQSDSEPDEVVVADGAATGADKKAEKKETLGAWKDELRKVTQDALPEEDLHMVRWGAVLLNAALLGGSYALFVGFVFVSQVGAVWSLPLFMTSFILAAILFELNRHIRLQKRIIVAVVLVAAIVGGAVVLGPFGFFKLLSRVAFLPLLVCVVLVRLISLKSVTNYVQSSPLWQALTGLKEVAIKEERDLVMFLKSIAHKYDPWEKRNPLKAAWLTRIGFPTQSVQVELVRVDESSADVPDVPLTLSGQEVEPFKYGVVALKYYNDDGVEDPEGFDIKVLERLIQKRKQIADKLLDNWINPAKQSDPAAGDPAAGDPTADVANTAVGGRTTTAGAEATGATTSEKPKEDAANPTEGGKGKDSKEKELDKNEEKVTKFGDEKVFQEFIKKANLAPKGKGQIIVCLSPFDYFSVLFEHWVMRACQCVVYCAFLSLPTMHMFIQIDAGRRDLCRLGKEHELKPVGPQYWGSTLFCDSSDPNKLSCETACKSLLTFAEAVHDVLHTSYTEMTIVFVLLPVFIFTSCVRAVRAQHTADEMVFLRRMPRAKKAVYEVMKVKQTMEDIFDVGFLFNRFATSFRAWLGADDALNACGPITDTEFDLTGSTNENNCFKEIMEPVGSMKSTLEYDKTSLLPYGVAYPEGSNADDPDSTKNEILNYWRDLKFKHHLGGATDRNYKVLFDLEMRTEDSWNCFKDWIGTNKEGTSGPYKKQFDAICKEADVESQDSGKGCHLMENTGIFDIVLPRGFSLTHIFCQSMPEDGKPYQIEVRGFKRGANKGFFEPCKHMVRSIKNAKVDNDEFNPDNGQSLLDYRLGSNPIVARFALSEQYFNNMDPEEVHRLCKKATWKEAGKLPTFTEFVDCLLEPEEFKVPDQPEGKSYFFFTAISVFMGDRNPFSAVLQATKRLLLACSVYVQCLVLAMLIPALRKFSGADLFPAPMFVWSVLNIVSIWILLVQFFKDFQSAQVRLGLVGECLTILRDRTLSPQVTASDGTEDPAKTTDKKEAQENAPKPFDLVVSEAKVPYKPGEEFWIKEWDKKYKSVSNWSAAVEHLRVFTSTSRLTAQTMLAMAAVVVGFMMVISMAQMAKNSSGGALAQTTARRLAFESAAGGTAAHNFHAHVMQALNSLADRRLAEASAPYTGGSDAAGAQFTAMVDPAESLRAAFVSSRAALHTTLARQARILAEGYREARAFTSMSPGLAAAVQAIAAARHGEQKADGVARRRLDDDDEKDEGGISEEQAAHILAMMNVAKATKTQIFTLAMVAFVLMYSVPLMWSIVQVNGHFDVHDDLLLKQMQLHRSYQDRREMKKDSGEKDPGAAGPTPSQMAAAEAAAAEAAATAATAAGENKDATAGGKHAMSLDLGCRRYEKALAVGIDSAKKTRERFPLKLFGFVITSQLLATWVGLAGAPIIGGAKAMAPPIAVIACMWIEQSPMVKSLQKTVDRSNPEMHMNITSMIHDNLCVPIHDWVETLMDADSMDSSELASGLADRARSSTPDGEGRRLLARIDPAAAPLGAKVEDKVIEVPDIREILHKWWLATPTASSETKFHLARRELMDLDMQGDRLLGAAPAQVTKDFQEAMAKSSNTAGLGDIPFASALRTLRFYARVSSPVVDAQDNGEGRGGFSHDEF